MAEGQVLIVPEEPEVNCPVCLDSLKEPQKLPCNHVYCKECLRELALHSQAATISCPVCRHCTVTPLNYQTVADVNLDFPTDFWVSYLTSI